MSDRVVVMNHGVIEQVGTPREIYEEPNNLSVAEFIGEANIFEPEILEYRDHTLVVSIEGKIFELANKRGAKPGQRVHVLVRPEDLRAWDRSELEGNDIDRLITVIVEQVIYKGSTVDLILRTASGKLLRATEFFDEDDETLDFKVGEQVWVEWKLGWEVVLPHE